MHSSILKILGCGVIFFVVKPSIVMINSFFNNKRSVVFTVHSETIGTTRTINLFVLYTQTFGYETRA